MEGKAELFPELIFDILLRLPVKSLLRFMCISKSWYTLISSPQFIRSHLKTSNAANRKLIFSTFLPIDSMDCSLTECDFNSALHAPMTEATNLVYPNSAPMLQDNKIEGSPKQKVVEIIGSCNGLVCLATDQLRTCLFIWNPSIRRYKKLPRWSLEYKYSNLAYGFAYDELHDDYKVVAIIVYQSSWDPKEYAPCIKVYSQRTNSWNRIKDSENYSVPRNWGLDFNRCGTFVNGKLHWIARGPPYRIVSFDLADETSVDIEHLPENRGERSSSVLTMGVLGEGYLALLWQPDWQKLDLDVWIMTEYGVAESWTKLYSIRYPYSAYVCLGDIRIQPLLVLKEGEFLFKLGSKLVIYNPEDDSCKNLNISHNLRQISGSLKVNMYDESLVLLDARDG